MTYPKNYKIRLFILMVLAIIQLKVSAQVNTLAIDSLNKKARSLIFSDFTQAIQLTETALRLSQEIKYVKGEATAYRNFATIYSRSFNFYYSLKFSKLSLKHFQQDGDSAGVADNYITLGHTFRRQNEHTTSYQYYLKATNIYKELNQPERLAVCLHSLGEAELALSMFDKAIENNKTAIKIFEESGEKAAIPGCYNVIAWAYLKMNDNPKAKEFFDRALALYTNTNVDMPKEIEIRILTGLARYYHEINQIEKEQELLFKAFQLAINYQAYYEAVQVSQSISLFRKEHPQIAFPESFLQNHLMATDSLFHQLIRNHAGFSKIAMETIALETQNEKLAVTTQVQAAVIDKQSDRFVYLIIIAVLMVIILAITTISLKQIRNQSSELKSKSIKLQEALDQRNKFFSIVAHDLRSPLTTLAVFSDLLAKRAEVLSTEELKKMGAELKESVTNTLKMTENLLTWARSQAEEHTIKKEKFDLGASIKLEIELLKEPAKEKLIEIHFQPAQHTWVEADKNQMAFVFRNLINNAIKFSKVESTITISISANKTEHIISIVDQGLGITQEKLNLLFQAGKKVTQLGTKGEKGTGLGLVLCKEFIQKNNGSIQIYSDGIGKGTTAIVKLPKIINDN